MRPRRRCRRRCRRCRRYPPPTRRRPRHPRRPRRYLRRLRRRSCPPPPLPQREATGTHPTAGRRTPGGASAAAAAAAGAGAGEDTSGIDAPANGPRSEMKRRGGGADAVGRGAWLARPRCARSVAARRRRRPSEWDAPRLRPPRSRPIRFAETATDPSRRPARAPVSPPRRPRPPVERTGLPSAARACDLGGGCPSSPAGGSGPRPDT